MCTNYDKRRCLVYQRRVSGPMSDKLNLRDCCSVKGDVMDVIKGLVMDRNTDTIVLSQTRFITKGTVLLQDENLKKKIR